MIKVIIQMLHFKLHIKIHFRHTHHCQNINKKNEELSKSWLMSIPCFHTRSFSSFLGYYVTRPDMLH